MTETVDILPFVGQSLRTDKPVAPKVIPEIKPQSITAFQAEKTPVNFEKPTGNYSSPHPSIKELLNPIKVEQINSNLENAPREIFSEDQLKMVWKQYSFIVKEQGLETFYNALIKRNPIKQSDEVYVISLDNEIQKEYILSHIDPFLLHLRRQLKNYSIKIPKTGKVVRFSGFHEIYIFSFCSKSENEPARQLRRLEPVSQASSKKELKPI